MAEEGAILPATPESIKFNRDYSRRHSMGKSTSFNGGDKVLPHYLRASTGSCHDFCKYGRKHAFEAKARHPISKRIVTKPSDDKNPVENAVLLKRKKTSGVKLATSAIIKCKMSAKAPIMREVYTKSPDSQNPMVNEVATEKEKNNKTSLIKLRPSPNSRSHISDTPETIKQVVSSPSGKVGFSSKQASSNVKEISLSEKHATSLKLKSGMEIRLPAKLAISLKPMMDKPLSSSGGLSGRRISDVKIEKSTGTLKVPVKRVLASPRAALSPKPSLVRVASINARKNRSLKVVSSLKDQKEMRNFESGQCIDELEQPLNDTVQEKTLYVIKMESDNKSLKSDEKESYVVDSSSPRSLSSLASSPLVESPFSSSRNKEHQEESENRLTEAEEDSHSEYGETVNMKETESSEEEHEWRTRKGHSEGTDCQPVKLNFRRGKVVDIQSEHNTPRRLRFRRGRVLGDNQNVKGNHQGSFKRRGVSDGDTNDSKPDSVKVALRHQDVQGKKDSQGLLNNVIEETASKLVETRKSKVKALVGAFETVISLQESKLYANPLT